MTSLKGDLRSIMGTPFGGVGHAVLIFSRVTRAAFNSDSVVLQLHDRIEMPEEADGKFRVDGLDPGPIRIELEGGTVHNHGWNIDLPDEGVWSLTDLVDAQVDWSPAVIGRAEAAARESREHADRAEAGADRVGTAEQVGVWASEASSSASAAASARSAAQTARNASQSARDAAEGHANRAAASESNAATSETNAKQSETNAGDYAAVATTAATEAVDAMELANTAVSSIGDSVSEAAGHADRAGQYEAGAASYAQNASDAADRVGTAEQVGTWASEASASASAAASARAGAITARDAAQSARNDAEGHANSAATSESKAKEYRDAAATAASTTVDSVRSELRGVVSEASGYANESSRSAARAKTSETNAKTSETNASTHAANSFSAAERAEFAAEETIQQVEGDFATRNYVDEKTKSTSFVGYEANVGRHLTLDSEGKVTVATNRISRPIDMVNKEYVDGALKAIRIDSGDANTYADERTVIIASAVYAKQWQNLPVELPGYLVNLPGGIKFQLYYAYGATPAVYIRTHLVGGEWTEWNKLGESAQGGGAALNYHVRSDIARKRHGYRAYTNGLPVVMLRFDDYPQQFKTKVLPTLRENHLPAYFAVTKRWVEDLEPTPWDEVEGWCLNDGIRMWNHSMTHSNHTTRPEITDAIINAADYFEQQMPNVAIDGWVAPGVGTSPAYVDFDGKDIEDFTSSYAGKLIMSRHGIINGARMGYLQPMGGHPIAQTHETYDDFTLAQFKARVQESYAGPYALSMMIHPGKIGTTGGMSQADFDAAMAWLAAERDAGRVLVLTGDIAPALDPGFGQRNDLMPVRSHRSLPFSQTVNIPQVAWARGGSREIAVTLKAAAPAQVTLTVSGWKVSKAVTYSIPAGVSTVRTFITVPLSSSSIDVGVSKISGGLVNIEQAHMWAA